MKNCWDLHEIWILSSSLEHTAVKVAVWKYLWSVYLISIMIDTWQRRMIVWSGFCLIQTWSLRNIALPLARYFLTGFFLRFMIGNGQVTIGTWYREITSGQFLLIKISWDRDDNRGVSSFHVLRTTMTKKIDQTSYPHILMERKVLSTAILDVYVFLWHSLSNYWQSIQCMLLSVSW